jgi:hypothetical protein
MTRKLHDLPTHQEKLYGYRGALTVKQESDLFKNSPFGVYIYKKILTRDCITFLLFLPEKLYEVKMLIYFKDTQVDVYYQDDDRKIGPFHFSSFINFLKKFPKEELYFKLNLKNLQDYHVHPMPSFIRVSSEQIRNDFDPQNLQEAHALLGISSAYSSKQIFEQYKELKKKNGPNRNYVKAINIIRKYRNGVMKLKNDLYLMK